MSPNPARPRARNFAFLVVALLLLFALGVLLRPAPPPRAPAPAPEVPPASALDPLPPETQAAPAAPEPVPAPTRSVSLVVRGGALAEGPATLQVTQGDTVAIRIVSDAAEQLHLHGYDLALDLEPGRPASLLFVADRTGRFEYELEHAQREIGVLEVRPR
jgi:FtsP/CotA-like multicopper oxidase with cupredoxin domain